MLVKRQISKQGLKDIKMDLCLQQKVESPGNWF